MASFLQVVFITMLKRSTNRPLFCAGGRPLELGGILLTHAHTGHYTGLLKLGKEGADMGGVPVSGQKRSRGLWLLGLLSSVIAKKKK